MSFMVPTPIRKNITRPPPSQILTPFLSHPPTHHQILPLDTTRPPSLLLHPPHLQIQHDPSPSLTSHVTPPTSPPFHPPTYLQTQHAPSLLPLFLHPPCLLTSRPKMTPSPLLCSSTHLASLPPDTTRPLPSSPFPPPTLPPYLQTQDDPLPPSLLLHPPCLLTSRHNTPPPFFPFSSTHLASLPPDPR
ncbi:hypothetical protein Pcinc_031341 [Petrolisthes cinctipes]|uniref:Uncharacterized protein n=1 Tax=Petrolisthes cinctipes TaxID=88211 RepID=A0AAE1EWK3_PETCI|nr:hypothetical protein Pcinc_031341 [Petrolisthes cinctipes]